MSNIEVIVRRAGQPSKLVTIEHGGTVKQALDAAGFDTAQNWQVLDSMGSVLAMDATLTDNPCTIIVGGKVAGATIA